MSAPVDHHHHPHDHDHHPHDHHHEAHASLDSESAENCSRSALTQVAHDEPGVQALLNEYKTINPEVLKPDDASEDNDAERSIDHRK